MKFRGTKISKRTLPLLAAAVLALGGGTVGTMAAPNVTSQDYDASIQTNSIDVSLTENDTVLGDNGELFASFKDGTFVPGKTYEESIGVENTGAADEYVRVIVRRYWTKGEKKTELTQQLEPEWIELTPASGWTEVKSDSNDEYSIYYLADPLGVGESKELFSAIRIGEEVLTEGKKIMIGTTEYASDAEAKAAAKDGDIIKYTYTYDGCTYNVEAEAQSVQTHHAADAIKSVWGVDAGSVGVNAQ